MSRCQQQPRGICKNRCSYKFHNFRRKTTMLESPFNKVAILQSSNFTEKRIQHRYFPVKFAEFLRIPTLKNICELLLLSWRSCGATKVWCWSKKMAGVEILVRVEQMILWTFIMILWSFTYDSSHFSFLTLYWNEFSTQFTVSYINSYSILFMRRHYFPKSKD